MISINKLIFNILLISFTCYGIEITITKEDGKLFLITNKCEDIENDLKSLKQWTQQLNQACTYIINSEQNNCKVDITQCVPNHILKYQGVLPDVCGPNCWNLALVMNDLLPGLRYTTPEEISSVMDSPMCRKLNMNEKRFPGDIGLIRQYQNSKRREIHAFVYISENLAYSKNGWQLINPYQLQSLEHVEKFYQLPDDEYCKKNRMISNYECSKFTEYYRCISHKKYLEDNKDKISPELFNFYENLDKVECNISGLLFEFDLASQEYLKLTIDIYLGLSKYLFDQLKSIDQLNQNDRELIKLLRPRLTALKSSIKDLMNKTPFYQYEYKEIRYGLLELQVLLDQSIELLKSNSF
jgi:hypothetical protein